uniref:Uncharacterized protein n=1 Tax=Raoultella ornithinolytica TaxID=54291 RepID=A0A0M4KK19_RAOOR|nr:hypothetical protein [Raoultella ornithinolytica]
MPEESVNKIPTEEPSVVDNNVESMALLLPNKVNLIWEIFSQFSKVIENGIFLDSLPAK